MCLRAHVCVCMCACVRACVYLSVCLCEREDHLVPVLINRSEAGDGGNKPAVSQTALHGVIPRHFVHEETRAGAQFL